MDQLRVLLVDDNPDDADLFGYQLRLCRHLNSELRWVSTPEQAHEEVGSFDPHVIFVDYKLGPASGLDLLNELIARLPSKPAIMLTGHGSEEVATEAMRAGAADYLSKARLSAEALDRSITNAMEKFAMREEIDIQRHLLDSISEVLFTIDTEHSITSFNRAAEKFFGISREQAIGQACHEILDPLFDETSCPLHSTMENEEPIFDLTMTAHFRGRKVTLSLSTALLRDSAGVVIGGIQSIRDLSRLEELRRSLRSQHTFEGILGKSEPMRALFDAIPSIATTTSTVLIEGASGTGKELIARAVHSRSPRADGPFVAVNCAALPESLIESELFGYRAGAFTGAQRDKPGRFEMAAGGTIFLDEIGDVPLPMQTKLLRVLQEHVVEPLGAVQPVSTDVRVVAATNRSLADEVSAGRFREDLFFRLSVVNLKLPTLAERREDIPLLIQHFLDQAAMVAGRDVRGIAEDAMARLLVYGYPGNVRELENVIEHGVALCDGPLIKREHLPQRVTGGETEETPIPARSLDALEASYIEELLRRHDGNRSAVARELGVHPSTLYRKIRSLGIRPPSKDGRSRTESAN